MKPDRREAIRLAVEIKQRMAWTGCVYPTDATQHIPEPMRSAVIHGICHGTNTLGFREMTEEIEL